MKDPKTHQQRRLVLGAQTMGVLLGRWNRAKGATDLAEVDLSDDAFVFSREIDGMTPYPAQLHHAVVPPALSADGRSRPGEVRRANA